MIRLLDILRENIIEKEAIPTIHESLPYIEALGDKTLLTRKMSNIRIAAKVTSGPITKGRIGSALHKDSPIYDKEIAQVFEAIINKFKLEHIIYCSHGKKEFILGGGSFWMIPVGETKTIWSPQIKDIYSDLTQLKKKNQVSSFPIDSYTNTWPVGDVDEILVDCKSYYMISKGYPIILDYLKKNRLQAPQTYSELYLLLSKVIEPFKERYKL